MSAGVVTTGVVSAGVVPQLVNNKRITNVIAIIRFMECLLSINGMRIVTKKHTGTVDRPRVLSL